MPIYDYECEKCGLTENVYARYEDNQLPCKCGRKMKRIISGNKGIAMGVGAYGYYDDNLESYVSTNKQKRELMREKGVSEKYGKGWW